jgi:predicted dehydrogenase
MDEIRVGFIGAGANTRKRHIPGLEAQKGVEIVAVANRTRESGEIVAKEFEIPKVYDSWLEIIDDEDIDAVCIGTWPYMHAPMTIAALEAGKHVLVEARMAMNSHEAREMLAVSKANPDLVAQIVPAPHTLPVDRTIMDMIGSGYIGELVNMRVAVGAGSSFPNAETPLHWRHDRDLSGNNIMTMGIWYEALMRWVGPAATVQALGQVVVKKRRDDSGRLKSITIPDQIDILCRMACGGTMNMSVTTVSGMAPNMEVWIYGTEGTLRLEAVDSGDPGAPGLKLSGARRGEKALKEVTIEPSKKGKWRVEEEFINAINGEEPVTHTSFTDGVKYMEWTDAVTRAHLSGETVALPLQS